MPNKPHAPRGSKKSVPPEEDTSYIIFDDGKGKKKKKGGNTSNATEDVKSDAKGKGKAPAEQPADAPKKPDTRTLIAGASWTGKLPVSLLSEYFQKQKWNKPDYKMRNEGGVYSAHVVVSKTNPKTRETTTLPPIHIPLELAKKARQPSAVEARNFAAAYTLFRIASAKNMHMMLPPTYKDLWKGEFNDLKKQDESSGKAWMYEADPFFGYAEREKAKEVAAKEREKKEKARAEAAKAHNLTPGMSTPNPQGAPPSRNILKGWERVPKIELGKRTRKQAERLIRRDALWNPNGMLMDVNTRIKIEEEVTNLGFRRSHVEEACDICKDREEVIEWLLIHVPEDDLPPWSLPEGYVAGISMASANLKREGAIKRLAAAGYAVELCEEAYDGQGGNERKAAALLQAHLLRPTDSDDDITTDLEQLAVTDNTEDADMDPWEEEMSSLEAIYDKLFSKPSSTMCRIELDIKQQGKRLILQVYRPFGPYPAILPIITFEAAIPAYIRLSIIRKALLHAEENFIGMPMIYDIVDWLQQNAGEIFKNPGRLTDVSAGLSADHQTVNPQSHAKRKSRPRRPIEWKPATSQSQKLLADWEAKQGTPTQQKMMAARQSLPAWRLREQIVKVVNQSQVTIISGETGSGKSSK